jgi:hypothetical protein
MDMLDVIKEHLTEIISFLAGVAGGSFLTLRITRDQRAAGRATISDQRRARAGGDIVGRDKLASAPPTRRQP